MIYTVKITPTNRVSPSNAWCNENANVNDVNNAANITSDQRTHDTSIVHNSYKVCYYDKLKIKQLTQTGINMANE